MDPKNAILETFFKHLNYIQTVFFVLKLNKILFHCFYFLMNLSTNFFPTFCLEIGYEAKMILCFIFYGLVSTEIVWRDGKVPTESSSPAYTRLLVSGRTVFIGGSGELLKLERDGDDIQKGGNRNRRNLRFSKKNFRTKSSTFD